ISQLSFKNPHDNLHAVVEYGDHLIWEIDRKGYFTYVSKHVQTLLGYKDHELIGKKIFDFMPKVEVKRVLPIYQDAFCHKDKIKDLLNVKVNKEGKSIYLLTNASPFFDEDGKFLGYRGVDKNVSKEIRLEHQLKQQKIILHQREEEFTLANTQLIEKAQKEALRAKSQFFSNLSDDVRSPIGEVVNIAHMALGSELEPKKRKYLEDIEMSANSLLTLLDHILDLSKLEVGDLHLNKQNFDLIKTIDNMMHLLDLQAQAKGLKIDVSYGQKVQRYYIGDPRRLSQIISNLISNAINFSQYGTIEFFIDQIDREQLRFEVRDCGMGLSQKEQEDLFKPFDQIDSAMSLGLTLSKHLVEMMEGKIWCECETENGGDFIFEIKLEEGQKVERDVQKEELLEDLKNSLHSLKGSNVLLVENHLSDQEMIISALDHSGIIIDTAQNSMEAIRMYQDHPTHYELILMDVKMPILSGIEVVKQLRHSGATITIIGLIDDEERADQSKELFNEYLSKPIRISKLYKALLKHITPKRIVSDKVKNHKQERIFPEFNTVDTALGL
ncbi:MAG: ATP-binding protein, partial [Campylobacterota bacterium]|nr:ATP-binding protein [Campylobacterota bacterium]